MDSLRLNSHRRGCGRLRRFGVGVLRVFWQPLPYQRHQGSFDIVHVKDSAGHIFATRLGNVFVIGEGTKPLVSLPKSKCLKISIIEQRALRPPKA